MSLFSNPGSGGYGEEYRVPRDDWDYYLPGMGGQDVYYDVEMEERADAQERYEMVQDMRDGTLNPWTLSN